MRLVLSSVLLLFAVGLAKAESPGLTDIRTIPIHDGINVVPKFASDGRSATIVRAWRDNGNAHGHYVYLVLLPLPAGCCGSENKSGVVALDGNKNGLEDTAVASPFDGERTLGTIRFARGRLDGVSATLLIRADLGEARSGVLADHAPAEIRIYKLERPGVAAGTTPDVFHLVRRIPARGSFCNADMALSTTIGLPLPPNYSGGKAPTGC
ncbi:hypothetical protein [Bradyrhizobium sp. USDA 4473]